MKAFFFCSFLLSCFNPSFTAADSPEYRDCAPASCNGIDVQYPFSLYASTPGTSCGIPGLKLTCEGHKADALLSLITPTDLKLIVKSINYTTQTIKLAIDRNLLVVKNQCPIPSKNITLSDITNSDGGPILSVATNYRMGTFFFGCSTKPIDISNYNFTSSLVSGCSDPGAAFYSYAFYDDSFNNPSASWTSCRTTLSFPVLISSSSHDAGTMWTSLTEGFDVVWRVNSMGDCLGCTASGGHCGYNITGDFFLCFHQHHAIAIPLARRYAPAVYSPPSRQAFQIQLLVGWLGRRRELLGPPPAPSSSLTPPLAPSPPSSPTPVKGSNLTGASPNSPSPPSSRPPVTDSPPSPQISVHPRHPASSLPPKSQSPPSPPSSLPPPTPTSLPPPPPKQSSACKGFASSPAK
ncbi:uncharacterized protein LOC116264781 [Nymphaea colorata]|uniref:uncharacterized protein LOC116264781 n=1 Tax=Nymphaea colorata TaxID=210225 RepID=UPI00129E0280|nr:uncharacterized protein LOC116264781 [Nymphaea colorata]XP_049936581.1 uncharacterized protein LOC116264781 [Nymphaea colorata]